MEMQFVAKALRKPYVVVIVGEEGDDSWQQTVVGMLCAGHDPIDMRAVGNGPDTSGFDAAVERVVTMLRDKESTMPAARC